MGLRSCLFYSQVSSHRRVLVVGCGLGDDAEYLSKLGANVTAFDLSQTAIDWCHQRFPDSKVNYQAVDLFTAPADWKLSFDLVVEIYTIQALPANIRPHAIESIGNFVAPNGLANTDRFLQLKFCLKSVDISDRSRKIGEVVLIYDENLDFVDENWMIDIDFLEDDVGFHLAEPNLPTY